MARLGTGMTLLLGAAAGAAAQYFLDRQAGRQRREAISKQGMERAKRQASGAARKFDVVAGQAKGAMSSAIPHGTDLGDAGLAHKVESEIFRAADAPKGQVAVNAENGVIFLRGEVEGDWIERLGSEAEQVGGVKAVRNLLHPPGTPAPSVPVT